MVLAAIGIAPRVGAAPPPGPPPPSTVEGEQVEPDALKPSPKKKRKRPRFMGHPVKEDDLRRDAFPRPSGDLYIFSPNHHEEVKVNIYNANGSFNEDSLKSLNHLFRCRRTDSEKPMEPHLFEILSAVQDRFPGHRLEVISGFRNQRKVSSMHFHATAADIHVPGVPERKLRDFISTLDSGGLGIGLYPAAHFVHVDVRPDSYRWVDYSRSGDGAIGRLPPRGFKKKTRPES